MTERPLRLVYEGRTDGVRYGSWALVNRRLLDALRARPDVEVVQVDPGASPRLDGERSDVWLSHYYPGLEPGRLFVPPSEGVPWVCWVAWEVGPPPLGWLDAWEVGKPAEVWACSAHARRLLLAGSDLDPAGVRVVHYGVDPDVFSPDGERWRTIDLGGREGLFRVLYVGGAVERKGCDLALAGYCRAFTPEEPTRLVLKLQGVRTFYEQAVPIGAPDRRSDWGTLTSDRYPDSTMASLFRSVDVVVQPYRAEGFCLPLLEAMASGVPVVYPAHGPGPEFVPPGAGICVPSTRSEADVEAIARALRWLWKHPDERKAMGEAGRRAALDLAWAHRAEVVVQALREVVSRPVAVAP